MDKSAYTGNSEMNTRFITTKNGKHNDRRSTLKQYWKYYWNNHEPNLTCAAQCEVSKFDKKIMSVKEKDDRQEQQWIKLATGKHVERRRYRVARCEKWFYWVVRTCTLSAKGRTCSHQGCPSAEILINTNKSMRGCTNDNSALKKNFQLDEVQLFAFECNQC